MDATYTAEQLREDAHRADGIGTMADGDQLRAHADALEENARLRADLTAERERADRAKAEGIKEGLRRAAEIADQHASVEGIAQRIRDAILKEIGA